MDDEYRIEVSIDVPKDSDGFIRRECPHCEEQFKWHEGPATEEAEGYGAPDAYYCPLCGMRASTDSWWTQQQLEVAQQLAMPDAMRRVQDDLDAMFRGMKGVTYKRSNETASDVHEPLVEPDDMTIVASPCHSWEPIKIPEDHVGQLHCLVCGAAFAV